MKKVIVLAGGNDQIELIKGLRKRYKEIEIILVDFAEKVRAAEYADKHYVISTMDKAAVLDLAKKENVDLILCACGDQPLTTMAYVSEQLKLNCYLTYQQSQNLTNKLFMKDIMVKNNIPTSRYFKINNPDLVKTVNLDYPLVVKPVDNNGSKGVVKVQTYNDLKEAVNEACAYSLSGDVIIEEFKKGEELSVEAFINKEGQGNIVIATKNIKIRDNNNRFTILRNQYIYQLTNEIQSKIIKIINQISESFQLYNSPLLLQLIVNNDEVNVIEFSARTGGGSKLVLVKELTGVDIIDNLIDITEGNVPNVEPSPKNIHAAVCYLYTKPGKVIEIKNFEQLKQEGVVVDTFYYKTFGTEIRASQYSSDRPAGFLITAETADVLQSKIEYVDDHLKILNESGIDIMLHGLFKENCN